MTYEVIDHHGAPAVLVDVDSPGVRAAVRAIEAGFGKAPVFIREGGSIPVVGLFKTQLGVDTLLLGWGQNDDNLHGPNEKFSPGRLPPRHQGQRPPARRSCRNGLRSEPSPYSHRCAAELNTLRRLLGPDVANPDSHTGSSFHARPEIRAGQRRGGQAELPQPERRRPTCSTTSTGSSRLERPAQETAPGVEDVRRRQNEVARRPARRRTRRNGPSWSPRASGSRRQVAGHEEQLKQLETEFKQRLGRIPNLTHPDAPVGQTEDESRELRKVGSPAPSTSRRRTTSRSARRST